jgi:hypothetical protein
MWTSEKGRRTKLDTSLPSTTDVIYERLPLPGRETELLCSKPASAANKNQVLTVYAPLTPEGTLHMLYSMYEG